MKLVNQALAITLQGLGYDGEYELSWVIEPHYIPRLEYCGDGTWDDGDYLDGTEIYPAPRLDDVAYWIREKYGIHICVHPYYEAECKYDAYVYSIYLYNEDGEYWSHPYELRGQLNHDDALEAAVHDTIKIIKEKKL